jgi:hypothetical protein
VLIALLFAASCAKSEPTHQDTASPTLDRDTLWERRRQCAAAIDDVLRHTGWSKPETYGFSVIGASSHYNETQDRCYVRVDITNGQGDLERGVPFSSYAIYDAFDAGTHLSCSDELAGSALCTVRQEGKETIGDCMRCRAVAEDLMNN